MHQTQTVATTAATQLAHQPRESQLPAQTAGTNYAAALTFYQLARAGNICQLYRHNRTGQLIAACKQDSPQSYTDTAGIWTRVAMASDCNVETDLT